MNRDEHPYTVWPESDEEQWKIGPIPDPRKGDREWSYLTEVEVECPRCGTPTMVPTVIYATTTGDSMVTMHAASSANPTHNCDDESAAVLDSDREVGLERLDEGFVVIQPYDDTEPESLPSGYRDDNDAYGVTS